MNVDITRCETDANLVRFWKMQDCRGHAPHRSQNSPDRGRYSCRISLRKNTEESWSTSQSIFTARKCFSLNAHNGPSAVRPTSFRNPVALCSQLAPIGLTEHTLSHGSWINPGKTEQGLGMPWRVF